MRNNFERSLGKGKTYTERDFEMYKLGVRNACIPVGLALVPVEPTSGMLDRGVAFALNASISECGSWTKYIRDLWVRMIDMQTGEVN